MPHPKSFPSNLGLLCTLCMLLFTTGCSAQLNRPQVMDQAFGFPGVAVTTEASENLTAPAAKERLIIRSGDLALSVLEPNAIQADVKAIIESEGGLISHSTASESAIWIESRIPADRLDIVMDRIAALGDATRRSVTAEDITEAHADLTSRLETSRQLRDRMRALLDRASDVKDLLAIETELARVQFEIEAMEKQLEGIDIRVRLSRLTIQLEQKRVFGPLGFVGYWTGWALSKLFIIH